MTIEQAEAAVIDSIVEIQEMSGRKCVGISAKTTPIGDVPGFDSLNALEATVEVAEKLKKHIPDETNIFINEDGDRALSVCEIAGRLMEIVESSKGIAHGKRG